MTAVVDTGVRLHIYEELVRHQRAPTVDETAAALGMPSDEAAAAYRRLADGRVIVLEPGTLDVWMANPFSTRPTSFRVTAAGREWWGVCAWDAPGILALLGIDGTIATACPDCDEAMVFRIEAGRMVGPPGAVGHFAVPATRWWDDIGFT